MQAIAARFVSKTQLAEWREMMTKEEWQREVEALWVENNANIFPHGPHRGLH